VPGGHLLGHQGDHLGFDVELGQVDGRHAVLARQELGEVLFLDGPHFHEAVAQTLPGPAGFFLCAL
jgi:hypothetical protein